MATEPMLSSSCRGRAEAFARTLHNKLRTLGGLGGLGGADPPDDDHGGPRGAIAARTLSASSIDSGSDIFYDLDLSPQSPEEEVTDSELAGMLAGSANRDQLQALDDQWTATSPQSDCSSDYYDPESFDDDGSLSLPALPEDKQNCKVILSGKLAPATCNGAEEGVAPASDDAPARPASPKSPLSPASLPIECNQCYSIVINGVTPYETPFCKCGPLSPHSSSTSPTMQVNGNAGTSPVPGSPSSPSKKRPWNRVQHKYKAGTPEAMKEVSQICLEDDDEEEEKPQPNPARTHKVLAKLNFSKTSQTRLQEDVIEQLKQGKDIPAELKNGPCPQQGDDDPVQACPRGLESIKQVARVLDDREADEEDKKTEEAVEDVTASLDSLHISEPQPCPISVRVDPPASPAAVPESCVRTEAEEEDDDDDRRPRIRRCSSLKTGKTPPGTPGRKKIVRFADVLGLDLADVRTFMDEIPKVPTSAYNDLDADPSATEPPLEPALPQLALCFQTPVETPLPFGARPTRCLVPLFQQPGGMVDFIERVRERQVCLENAVVKDAALLSIAGAVRVRNLDFHKTVHLRYTTDGWKSFADLQATYVPNSCDGFSDKFTFVLYAAHTMSVGQRLEIAVRFQCKGQQYWDSNGGANYCFQCLPASAAPPPPTLPSPDDAWKSFY